MSVESGHIAMNDTAPPVSAKALASAWGQTPAEPDTAALAELARRPSLIRPAGAGAFSQVALYVSVTAVALTTATRLVELLEPFEVLARLALLACVAAVVLELSARLGLAPLRLRSASERRDALLFALVAAGLVAAARLSGGGEGPLAALPLTVTVFAGAVLKPRMALWVTTLAAGLLATLYLDVDGPRLWATSAGLASTAVGCGALSTLALRGAALRFRDRANTAAELRLQRLLDDARAYRLTSSTEPGDAEHKRSLAAVLAVRERYSHVLEVVDRALRPHSAMLLFLDEAADTLQIREFRSRSDHVVTASLPAGRGVLGSVVSRSAPVNLQHLKADYDGLPYYDPPEHPASVLGVPVLEGEHLRGVLLVDRLEDQPFSPADEALLTALAREVVSAAEIERLFSVMDRDRRSQEALLRLAETLNAALTLEATLDALVDGVREVARCGLAAVVLREDDALRVVRVRGDVAPPDLEGRSLPDEGSLVASAIRTQTALPARAELEPGHDRGRIFGPGLDVPGLRRAKVIPLVHQAECVGALVIADQRPRALHEEVVRLLHVAAGYGAIALLNGRLYASMERMATRDGLTGLLNHRTFQELLSQALARSGRMRQPLTLMLCDIDHFKQVNDLYGHPTGDEVLRRVAQILLQEARCTDSVARYGGEEFAVIMEGTDAEGALLVAERIRHAIAAAVVTAERGPLQVTLSAGLATFPADCDDRAELIKRADSALYQAKHAGRNRSVHTRNARGSS